MNQFVSRTLLFLFCLGFILNKTQAKGFNNTFNTYSAIYKDNSSQKKYEHFFKENSAIQENEEEFENDTDLTHFDFITNNSLGYLINLFKSEPNNLKFKFRNLPGYMSFDFRYILFRNLRH